MAEVAGAVGNIAVNTGTVDPNSNLGKAITAYNLGMAVIGVKNIAVGGYKFVSKLPQATKTLLQENKGLRDLLTAQYLEWKTLTTKLDNLSTAEKQLVAEQEKVWKALGIADNIDNSVLSIAKYSIKFIEKETGFVDLLPNLLQKEGLTIDDFHYMMQKNVNALTDVEKLKLTNIRNALPKSDANTIMQKAIPQRDIAKYLSGQYDKFGGFVSRASDAKHLKNFEDVYNGLRLDYSGTTFFVEEGSCGLIRFRSSDIPSKLIIPKGGTFDTYDYPFTSTGFTSGKQGRLGVPELNLTARINFSEGDEIWEIFNDGSEKLRAMYNKNLEKFVIIK